MIIGLEWIPLSICILAGLFLLASIILVFVPSAKNITGIFGCISTSIVIIAFCIFLPILVIQENVDKKYVDYLELKNKATTYETLDVSEQYELMLDIYSYNLWYTDNKLDLENEWCAKGTSNYAKLFEYIEVVR